MEPDFRAEVEPEQIFQAFQDVGELVEEGRAVFDTWEMKYSMDYEHGVQSEDLGKKMGYRDALKYLVSLYNTPAEEGIGSSYEETNNKYGFPLPEAVHMQDQELLMASGGPTVAVRAHMEGIVYDFDGELVEKDLRVMSQIDVGDAADAEATIEQLAKDIG